MTIRLESREAVQKGLSVCSCACVSAHVPVCVFACTCVFICVLSQEAALELQKVSKKVG